MRNIVSNPNRAALGLSAVIWSLVASTTPTFAGANERPSDEAEQPADATPTSITDVAALELAGFRSLALLVFSSDPIGSAVQIDGEATCYTPCETGLPPGSYTVTFVSPKRKTVVQEVKVTSSEQIQVHAVHGKRRPWRLIVPIFTVGGIFVGAGISSLAIHWGNTGPQEVDTQNVPADERVFHRNLGITSLVIGLPLLGLATYMLATGSPSETRVTNAPKSIEVSLAPVIMPDGTALFLQGTF